MANLAFLHLRFAIVAHLQHFHCQGVAESVKDGSVLVGEGLDDTDCLLQFLEVFILFTGDDSFFRILVRNSFFDLRLVIFAFDL